MGDDLMAWRLRIGRYRHRAGSRRKSRCTGTFKPRKRSRKRPTTVNHQEAGYSDDSGDRHSFPHKPTSHSHSDTSWMYIMSMCLRACVLLLLVTSMSVEPNPGPRTPSPSRAPDPQRTIGGPPSPSRAPDPQRTIGGPPSSSRSPDPQRTIGGPPSPSRSPDPQRTIGGPPSPSRSPDPQRTIGGPPSPSRSPDPQRTIGGPPSPSRSPDPQRTIGGPSNQSPNLDAVKTSQQILRKQPWNLSPRGTRARSRSAAPGGGGLFGVLKEKKREGKRDYLPAEDKAIVRYLAKHPGKTQGNSWPQPSDDKYWKDMSKYVQQAAKCQKRTDIHERIVNPKFLANRTFRWRNMDQNIYFQWSIGLCGVFSADIFGKGMNVQDSFGHFTIHMPKDYREWYTLMETEFGTRFSKLFRGPAWSGCPQEDHNKPMKARINVAAVGHVTVTRDLKESDYTSTIQIQEAALKDLKRTNPEGRFWIKLDATDVKPCIQESVKGKWAGDVDMGDGELQKLRTEYEERVGLLDHHNNTMSFKDDIEFLRSGLDKAVTDYDKHFSDGTTSKQKLISLNWEVVEYSTLLQQALQFQSSFTDLQDEPPERVRQVHNGLKVDMRTYLKNLYKKKRTAATHVLVIMLSDERRNTKPYALPVQYLPYRSLKDEKVRVFTSALKKKMVEMNMKCIGTVTDGEFSTLRTSGEDGTHTHISELAKEARQSVSSKGYKTLKQMLIKTGESPDGIVMTKSPTHVPATVVNRLAVMMETLSFSDSLQIIRNELPPSKWDPLDVEEDDLQKMKTIIATYNFRHLVDIHKTQGRDFSKYTYIPGIDPVTYERHHEREDHNHIMKRIASHVRKGNVPDVDFGRWQEAVEAEIITDPILRGKRKQSVGDAERFLSYDVASFFKEKGYEEEARFVLTVARWHDASDGRGLSQEDRSTYNNDMMTMLLSHWIPDYNSESKDLSQIDVNIKPGDVMGFSRETIIGVTSNIDSQELRRMENATYGPEHPRAGTTDDVEMFFACLHRITKGLQCTLKEFQYWWQKLIIQFCARLNVDLPFYVWTISDRYSLDDQPSFDVLPDDEVDESGHLLTRLHRLSLRSREKSSVVIGRNTLATQHSTTIRRTQFRRPVPLPSVPTSLNTAAREGATQVLNKD